MPWGVAAAAVGAAGVVGGSLITSNAAKQAANATQAAADTATAEQRREYDIGQGNLKPWLTTGTSALNKLGGLYGLDTYAPSQPGMPGATNDTAANDNTTLEQIRSGLQAWNQATGQAADSGVLRLIDSGASLADVTSALQSLRKTTTNPKNTAFLDPIIQQTQTAASAPQGTFTPGTPATGTTTTGQPSNIDPNATFYQSPDYQFRLSQGIKGVDAGAAARGGLDSGATRKAEIEYAGNLASGEFGNYANRLANLAGIGQTAAFGDAQLGQNYATNVGRNAMIAGDNNASSYIAQGSNYGKAISDLANIGSGLITNFRPNSGYAAFNPNTGNWNPGPNGFPTGGFG